jgi:acyl dehydratase
MASLSAYTFSEITVGQQAEFSVVVTDALVAQFAAVSGDQNPLHMDEVYAASTTFKGRVVHGQLGNSFFSQLVGMYLPGKYALYLSQSTFFRAPMRIGMTLTVRGTVTRTTDATKTFLIKTQIFNSATDILLVDGEAMVAVTT